MVAASSARLMGLATWSSMPASRQRSRSPPMACAVMAMMGVRAPPGRSNARILRLTHEDKTFSGAFIASASIPWGASKGDDDLGGYHLVWTRDMVQSATALLACGHGETALRALVYLACTQHPDGSFAQNFFLDGTPYWTGIQQIGRASWR